MNAEHIPTPHEIALRCQIEQARWTASERAGRSVGRASQWRPTAVPESVLLSAISYADGCSESREHTPPSATWSASTGSRKGPVA